MAQGMAIGGLLDARRVIETMSKKFTLLSHEQGFCGKPGDWIYGHCCESLKPTCFNNSLLCQLIIWNRIETQKANKQVVSKILFS